MITSCICRTNPVIIIIIIIIIVIQYTIRICLAGGFILGVLSEGFCPGGFVRWVLSGGVCPGGFVLEVLPSGFCSWGGGCLRGFCPGFFSGGGGGVGGLSVGFCPGGLSRGVLSWFFFWGFCSRGWKVCPGGFCPRGFW